MDLKYYYTYIAIFIASVIDADLYYNLAFYREKTHN